MSVLDSASAVVSVVAAIVAAISAYYSFVSARNNGLYILDNQISAYLNLYRDVLSKVDDRSGSDPFSLSFRSKYTSLNRSDVQILAGNLVAVVERMELVGDRRAVEWKGFISAIEPAIIGDDGFLLEWYASTDSMRKHISDIRENLKKKMTLSKQGQK
jgi:hypothetical protein